MVKVMFKVSYESRGDALDYEITCSKADLLQAAMPYHVQELEKVWKDQGDTFLFEETVADNAVTRALLETLRDPSKLNTGHSDPNFYLVHLLYVLNFLWD